MRKKVLITGGSGFLGYHILKEAVKRDWEIIVVDKRPIPEDYEIPDKFIMADVRDLKFRDLMGIDYVIDLAWRTNIPDCMRHPEESTKDNIDMTVHLLEVCREAGVKKVVFPSTASLYSNNPTPWTEDMRPEPIEPYSWQKLSCEQLCQMYSKVHSLPTVILRFFQVFGEYQREDTVLAAFQRSIAEGKPVTLTETTAQSTFKSGQRDFIYAGDLAEAVCMAAESDKCGNGEVLNVATGQIHTIEEVAKALGADVKWIPRRPYEVERHEGDITKIKNVLGWTPKRDIIKWIQHENN